MSDNDIIKALGCCADKFTCDQCPYNDGKCRKMYKDAIDLIICQKAEIDRLRNSGMCASSVEDWQDHCGKIRVETIKEFADRLKASCSVETTDNTNNPFVKILYDADELIDNLAQEMTEATS